MDEEFDAVIVGARCAGSATAIALARRARRVLAIDESSFPSDTLSTHLFFPPHWAELERLGARDRVMALAPPLHTRAGLATPETEVVGPYSPYEGFSAGSCVRRPGLDLALVQTAREAGAEVRERTRFTGLLVEGGRVAGMHWSDGRSTGTVRARLLVGADGRHSSVAAAVGAREHHRRPNGRLMAYAYYDDPRTEHRHVAMQWRVRDELATIFPCDGDQSLVLLMPPVTQADRYRAETIGTFEATVAAIPALAERLIGCTRAGRVRVSYDHPSYFRQSQGPGWALAGDAGHFKDPVTAQGIRDALRFGRLLGEAAAPALDDPARLDAALAAWETDRDTQCLPMYQWSNTLGLGEHVSPIEAAAYAWFAERPGGATQILDVFSRLRPPDRVFTPARFARWALAAARTPGVDRAALARTVRRDLGRETARLREAASFRSVRDNQPRPAPADSGVQPGPR